jgi:hypothetical protein
MTIVYEEDEVSVKEEDTSTEETSSTEEEQDEPTNAKRKRQKTKGSLQKESESESEEDGSEWHENQSWQELKQQFCQGFALSEHMYNGNLQDLLNKTTSWQDAMEKIRHFLSTFIHRFHNEKDHLQQEIHNASSLQRKRHMQRYYPMTWKKFHDDTLYLHLKPPQVHPRLMWNYFPVKSWSNIEFYYDLENHIHILSKHALQCRTFKVQERVGIWEGTNATIWGEGIVIARLQTLGLYRVHVHRIISDHYKVPFGSCIFQAYELVPAFMKKTERNGKKQL